MKSRMIQNRKVSWLDSESELSSKYQMRSPFYVLYQSTDASHSRLRWIHPPKDHWECDFRGFGIVHLLAMCISPNLSYDQPTSSTDVWLEIFRDFAGYHTPAYSTFLINSLIDSWGHDIQLKTPRHFTARLIGSGTGSRGVIRCRIPNCPASREPRMIVLRAEYVGRTKVSEDSSDATTTRANKR